MIDMKISMSYSGGTSRGWQLAREFDRRKILHEFFTPTFGRKIDYLPAQLVSLLYGEQQITPENVKTSLLVQKFIELMYHTAEFRGAKPTERFRVNEMIDRSVARRLKTGSDVFIAEGQIALHSLRRAKEMGITTVLDRTNSHIVHQSAIWTEEHRKFGIDWVPNSDRVIEKGVREYDEVDYIFALSSFVRNTFLERGIAPDKVVCVPSGIDLSPFRQVDKEDDVFRIIYCGAIQLKKGVHYLLQAFDELRLKNAELWLIGVVGKEMTPFLEQYKGQYRHFGYVPNADLFKYYSQGSVYAHPSLEEGLAKVLIEAMACGLPTVATVNTGIEDLIQEGREGFSIQCRDVEALKEKLEYLYSNPSVRAEMGKNAQRKMFDEFTIEKYVERIMRVLSHIVSPHREKFEVASDK
jgi:glycosyltransferase involved in cell wall biosynthesis